MYIIYIAAFLFAFFDVFYYIRSFLTIPLHYFCFNNNGKFLEESVVQGICWTTDLDLMWHQNNARYLRECDFARFNLWLHAGVKKALKLIFTGKVIVGASTLRYRKPIRFGQRYKIVSKIVCWDDRAFYIEQKFVTLEDNFIRCIVHIKQNMLGISPADTIALITGLSIESPPTPEELRKWIEYNSISSEAIKKSQ